MSGDWQTTRFWEPNVYAWRGDMHGPSTAARLADIDVVVASVGGHEYLFNSTAEAKAFFRDKAPDVCLDESLAVALGSPLVYGERCPLDDISWHALQTGIAIPFNQAKILRLLLTAKRCRVRLRTIQAGQWRANNRDASRDQGSARPHGNSDQA